MSKSLDSIKEDVIEGVNFNDSIEFDSNEKTALSVRDGIVEYYGIELGLEPASKKFKVYRSPAEVGNVASAMVDLPVVDNHVKDQNNISAQKVGAVKSSKLIDFMDESIKSTLAVKNKVLLDDMDVINKKRGLSLGYNANLVANPGSSNFDYEQKNIVPYELAIVKSGRVGQGFTFLDSKEVLNKMEQKSYNFYDEEGAMNLEDIAILIQELPDILKKLPHDKLIEFLPKLQEIRDSVNQLSTSEEENMDSDEEASVDDVEVVEDVNDESEMKEDDKDDMKDNKNFRDSAEFKDALSKGIKEHYFVVKKAQNFLDPSYDYSNKDSRQIMRDTLTSFDKTITFTDSELDIAFKVLRKPESTLKNFGENKNSGSFSSLAKQEY